MLHINLDKCLIQLPLRLEKLDPAVEVEMPYGWLTTLGNLIADDILKITGDEKASFVKSLERHAGLQSTYALKAELHESLIMIYVKLASAKTSPDQKMALVSKLREGIHNCSPGFHDRVNMAVVSLSNPENLDELLNMQRQDIVSRAASQATDEVHANNRFFVIAQGDGYGVRPLNANDVYHGGIPEETIRSNLKEAFSANYTVFQILNDLQGQLESLVRSKGYRGRLDEGYKEKDAEGEGYGKFDTRLLNAFIDIDNDDLFLQKANADGITFKIVDINWVNVKKALLKKMRKEGYFVFSSVEEAYLDMMASDQAIKRLSRAEVSLFSTPNELVQALIFFKEWPADKKAILLNDYLDYAADAKAVLEKLENAPELYRDLLCDRSLQSNLLCHRSLLKMFMTKAIHDKRLDRVKIAVRCGVNINPFLVSLVENNNEAVMQWLASDATLRAEIYQKSMNAIADKMVCSQHGRQALLKCKRLQCIGPQIILGKPLAMWMERARRERNIFMRNGFFVLVNPEVVTFLQHIIYGEQNEAEAMLNEHQNNPDMLRKLLTAKVTVTDYSGRRIYGTGFRMALGAVDIGYHPDEECMVEMLQKWMRKLPDGETLMAAQIAQQFSKGYEEREKQRIKDDEAALIKVLDAIGKSNNNAECELALQEFDNYLKPKGVIRTGKHFNEKLQEKAYELYSLRYAAFGGSWDSHKNLLAWRKVIGRIQRNYTACLAQAASQGLYQIVDEGEKLQRTLKLRNDRGVRFYPLDLNPASRLGVDYAIGPNGAEGGAPGGVDEWREFSGVIQNFFEQKTQSLVRLMQRRENPRPARGCTVM